MAASEPRLSGPEAWATPRSERACEVALGRDEEELLDRAPRSRLSWWVPRGRSTASRERATLRETQRYCPTRRPPRRPADRLPSPAHDRVPSAPTRFLCNTRHRAECRLRPDARRCRSTLP